MNQRIWSILALFALVGVGLMTFSSNPYVDFATTDSAVFNYIGSAMRRGIVPYRDVFDHKGPLIYIINWLGSFVGPGLLGVWLIECALAIISFLLIWRWVSVRFGTSVAFVVLFPYAALFALFNNAGNLTETYAHFVIVPVVVWLLQAASENRPFTKMQSFASGVCFAAILLLRPNMGGIALITAIYFVCFYMRNKRLSDFLLNSVLVLLGVVALSLPFVIYLGMNSALKPFWDCYWTYNVSYAKNGVSCGSGEYVAFLYLFALVGLLPCFDRRWRRPAVYNCIFLLISCLAVWLTPSYKHYYLILLPGLFLPMAWCLSILREKYVAVLRKSVRVAFVGVCLLFVAKEAMQSNFDVSGLAREIKATHRMPLLADFKDSASIGKALLLCQNVRPGASLCFVGNSCEIYRRLNMFPATYHIYMPDNATSAHLDRMLAEIMSADNDYVMSDIRYLSLRKRKAIESRYEKIGQSGCFVLWEREVCK